MSFRPKQIRQLHSGHALKRQRGLMCALILFATVLSAGDSNAARQRNTGVAVGPQYGTTHVYVAPPELDAFVNSFVATFGGKPSKRSVGNALPTPSSAELQYVMTPVGALSIFAFQTPIPFPFGQERTGSLVTDMDQAIKEARADGAEVIVEPFKDPIGKDAIIQWAGKRENAALLALHTATILAVGDSPGQSRLCFARPGRQFRSLLCTFLSWQGPGG